MQLLQTILNLRRINLQRTALKVVEEQQHVALDLITQDQLFDRGIRGDGMSLGEYAPATIVHKKAVGLPYDHVTLFDTGDFHKRFFADTKHWPVIFNSADSKTDMILDKYGDQVKELTNDNIKVFAEHVGHYLKETAAEEIKAAFH